MPYKNPDDHKKQCKEYYESPEGKKKHRIKAWRRYGVRTDDWDGLYEYYLLQTHCWICNKLFNFEKQCNRKVIDHDHKTGEVRYICCSQCNLNIVS